MYLAFENFPAKNDGNYRVAAILDQTNPIRGFLAHLVQCLSRLMSEIFCKCSHCCTMIIILCVWIFYFYMVKELECERECSRGEDYRLIKLTITDFNVGAVCLLTFFLLCLNINICPLYKIYLFYLFFVLGKIQVVFL